MKEDKTFGVVARPKAPNGYIGRWVNVYDYGVGQAGGMYTTRSHADDVAKSYRHDCVYIWIKDVPWRTSGKGWRFRRVR